MHHFQLKPVRSLDSLRPAWSGHLRHGPPPSTVITNPREASSAKSVFSSSFRPLPVNNSFSQSKVNNSATANGIVKEVDKTSLLLTLPTSHNQNAEPDRFLRELHVHNGLTKPIVNSSSCNHENENVKSEEKFSLYSQKFSSQDIFAHTDSTPTSTWEPFDRPFKTSNFLNEVNEDDPFDTSKVFTPTYLPTAPLFNSTIPTVPVQFHHPLLHPFNTTSCSAHAKVIIIIHYLLRL